MRSKTTGHAISFGLIRLCLGRYRCMDNKVSWPDHTSNVLEALAGASLERGLE